MSVPYSSAVLWSAVQIIAEEHLLLWDLLVMVSCMLVSAQMLIIQKTKTIAAVKPYIKDVQSKLKITGSKFMLVELKQLFAEAVNTVPIKSERQRSDSI